MKTEDLILGLSSNLKPVHPPEGAWAFAFKWSLGSFVLIAVVLGFIQPRPDLIKTFRTVDTLLQILCFSSLQFAALFLLSWWSSPGRRKKEYLQTTCAVFGITLVLQILRLGGLNAEMLREGLSTAGSPCAVVALIVGVITGAFFTYKARQGAVTNLWQSGLIVGLASLGAGGTAITLHCPSDNGMHIMLWHFVIPMIAMTISGFLAGKFLLRW